MTDQVSASADVTELCAPGLILSLFPGVDLFGRAFELEGFCVVRGPDRILGGDIRAFHPVPGRFDGVIGGPPCPDFSRARRGPPSGYGLEMLAEFARCVAQAAPAWWLMENVPAVPDLVIPGYSHQRLDLDPRDFGGRQSRLRHFQFGSRDSPRLIVDRSVTARVHVEPCALASEGQRSNRRSWDRYCALQGLDEPLDLSEFTLSGRYRLVGNGVHIGVGRALARAVLALGVTDQAVCACGCGRLVSGRRTYAGQSCRKRAQRKRDSAPVIGASVITACSSRRCIVNLER